MRRMRPVRGQPVMVNVAPTGALESVQFSTHYDQI
jgi:hypothetical protein